MTKTAGQVGEGAHAEWEGAAAELLDATCTTAPVDAFALAAACGFEVRAGERAEAERLGSVIAVDRRQRPARQHMRIAHELGHFALERHGLEDSEIGARYVGGALLLPRREVSRDLTETAWSLGRLRELHVNVSAMAIAVRITQLRDAVVTVLDPRGRRPPWRVWSPWVADPRLATVSRWERDLAARAYAERGEARGDELCYAVPILDDEHHHRIIVVCELEQLSLRLG